MLPLVLSVLSAGSSSDTPALIALAATRGTMPTTIYRHAALQWQSTQPLVERRCAAASTEGSASLRATRAPALAATYRQWAQHNYLTAAAVQAGILRSISNLAAQCMMVARSEQEEVRLSTALTMGALGASVSGWGGASWQRFMERQLGRSVGRGRPSDVALKAVCDFLLWAPLANATYLISLALLRGECLRGALSGLLRCLPGVMALEAALFVPYSALAFRMIPLEVRPLASSCVGAAFTIGLSMMSC